jgi:CubicO group peptidase (beta-lactamase class C family)
MTKRLTTAGVLAVLLVACTEDAPERVFLPATTAEESREHHRKVPGDAAWWTVTGGEMAWMHKNANQLFPTVNVYRGGPVRELAPRPIAAIADFEVQTPQGPMRFEDFIHDDQSTTLGIIILHRGEIAFERYPRMRDYEKVTYWSTVKVLVSTVLRLYEERGDLDVSQPISRYIPELAASSFADITVRNILDHATGLDCDDNYVDPASCYYRYSMAIGDSFRDETAPDNPYDFLATAEIARRAPQGTAYGYSGANNFILAWLVEKLSGHDFHDAFTQEVWRHIGAEHDAAYIAYRYGIPLTHGGFLATMRDFARFGLLFTPSWSIVSDRRIISDRYLELLRSGANPALGRPGRDGERLHTVYHWNEVSDRGYISHGGWGGQGLIIYPELDVVAVYTSYFKDDNHGEVPLGPVVHDVLAGVFVSPE